MHQINEFQSKMMSKNENDHFSSEKFIEYTTCWITYRYPIITGILLMPFVIGIPILVYYGYKLSNMRYWIYDDRIRIHDHNGYKDIPLKTIDRIRTTNKLKFLSYECYDILIESNDENHVLKAVRDASDLSMALQQAILVAKEFENARLKRESVQVKTDPGSLERLNDLFGLWQQQLISDEDYHNERKKFD